MDWKTVTSAALPFTLVFPALYPLYPSEWSTARHEAEAIALERLRDLGGEPLEDSSVTRLEIDGVLEGRLLDSLATAPADLRQEILASELGDRVLHWVVTTFDPASAGGEWDHRAIVSASGRVWALERRIFQATEEEAGGQQIFPGEARLEAAQFLEEQGFDIAQFADPVVFRRTWPTRVDLSLPPISIGPAPGCITTWVCLSICTHPCLSLAVWWVGVPT